VADTKIKETSQQYADLRATLSDQIRVLEDQRADLAGQVEELEYEISATKYELDTMVKKQTPQILLALATNSSCLQHMPYSVS
jgi:phage shock protein A